MDPLRLTPPYTKDQVKDSATRYFKGEALPADVFADKYALRDRENRFYELTPDDMHRRMAAEFARIEANYTRPRSFDEIYAALKDFAYIVPQGSPSFGIGNPHQLVSLSNCAVLDSAQDTLSGIVNTARDMANLYKRRFGAGLDISRLRPDGASVNNAAITSTGAHSFMDFYSYVTRMIGQSGRRGALMLTIDARHPDVLKFITKKDDKSLVTGANVSVKVDDEFMRAVEADGNVLLRWPVDEYIIVEPTGLETAPGARFQKLVKAREIFTLIAEQAAKNAEPGVLFWTTIQQNLPLDFYREDGFETISTNPCVTGDTHILTVDGPRAFADLAREGKDVLVYAVNKETNAPVVRWMRNPRKTRSNVEVLEIEFDSGLKVRATPDHNFIDFYGKKIKAADLKPGSSVGAFSLNKHRDGHLTVSRGVRGTAHDTYFEYSHRLVAEALGWDIEGKVVHHKDENPENNAPENLEILGSNSEHNSIHYPTRAANGLNGQYERTPEIREKISRSLRAYYDRDYPAGALMNHKVVSVRTVGTEDVYNGTVDDVHTYVIVDPEPITKSAKYTGILSANCGEIPLCAEDSCRLISIPLHRFVVNPFTPRARFDWIKFGQVVPLAMRLSDDLVDLEIEKLTAIREIADTEDEQVLFTKFIQKAKMGRRTGLGTHGLADCLAMLGLRYDSDEGVEYAEDIYRDLKLLAYEESVNLAEERGAFPIYNSKTEEGCAFIQRLKDDAPGIHERMLRHGRRNGAILTNAPTGSISILTDNCSSGIEPVFMVKYDRNRKVDAAKEDVTGLYRDAQGDYWKKYTVFHSNVERYINAVLADPESFGFDTVFASSPMSNRDLVIANLPDYFVEAGNIDWRQRVKMQAAIQKHIDHSISSTLNLPHGTTAETVADIYMAAWKAGCKGVTVYVDGSREAQVLSSSEKPKPEPRKELSHWPYCEECKEPYTFDSNEPFAYCNCGTTEWGDPRPAKYVANPHLLSEFEAMRKDRDEYQSQVKTLENALYTATRNCISPTHRGVSTEGAMTKATFRNHDGQERKVYVYIGTNDEGQPVEAFVTDEAGDEDFIPYAAALGKLVSKALKYGVPAGDVADTLIGLKGGSVSYSGKVYNSVPDLVGKLLAKVQREFEVPEQRRNLMEAFSGEPGDTSTSVVWGVDPAKEGGEHTAVAVVENEPAVPGTVVTKVLDTGVISAPTVALPGTGTKCPMCPGANVRKVDGCPSCGDCGWSRC